MAPETAARRWAPRSAGPPRGGGRARRAAGEVEQIVKRAAERQVDQPSTPPSSSSPSRKPPKPMPRLSGGACDRGGGSTGRGDVGPVLIGRVLGWPGAAGWIGRGASRANNGGLIADVAVVAQLAREIARGGRAAIGLFAERAQHQRFELRRDARVVHTRRRRVGADVLHRHCDRAIAAERQPVGQRLIQRHAQRVDIRARRGRLTARLLGRDIVGGAECHARSRSARSKGCSWRCRNR